MRTIAHLSDLHFCHLDPAILPVLRETLVAIGPDLLVVSGDLTQRARRREFAAAADFLNSLAFARVVVPGNHDVPLYDIATRWLSPFGRYKAFISADLEPTYTDEEIAVVGVNTARALVFKGGRINERQVARCEQQFASVGQTGPVTRVVVAHHPFILADGADPQDLVGRAELGLRAFARAGVDLILSGHLHLSQTIQGATRSGASALLIQAGTATSTRRRSEANAFNVLRIAHPEVAVERWALDDTRASFHLVLTERYRRAGNGWRQGEAP